jgi:poly-gamma-glutamate system protein
MKPLIKRLSFRQLTLARLVALAIALSLTWWLATPAGLNSREQALWDRVSAAQKHLLDWRTKQGAALNEAEDPWRCGLIGLEWSEISTTMGDVKSKRTACHPAWAIQFSRWFEEQGLAAGDPIAIYSSASFPGLLLSAIAAGEAMQLDILLVVSLGASSWGANDPATPWPLMAAELRRVGHIETTADFYTLGGGSELGNDMPPQGNEILYAAADATGVEFMTANDLAGMIQAKSEMLMRHRAKLLLSIGGSHANMGDDPGILKLSPGPVKASDGKSAGNGVIARALGEGIPVIHMLNLRELSRQTGIPYDSRPRPMAPGSVSALWSAFGLGLFFLVIARHRRWRIEASIKPEI